MYMVKAARNSYTQMLRIVLLFGQQAASKIIHVIMTIGTMNKNYVAQITRITEQRKRTEEAMQKMQREEAMQKMQRNESSDSDSVPPAGDDVRVAWAKSVKAAKKARKLYQLKLTRLAKAANNSHSTSLIGWQSGDRWCVAAAWAHAMPRDARQLRDAAAGANGECLMAGTTAKASKAIEVKRARQKEKQARINSSMLRVHRESGQHASHSGTWVVWDASLRKGTQLWKQ